MKMNTFDLCMYTHIVEYVSVNFDYDDYYHFFDSEDRHNLYMEIYNMWPEDSDLDVMWEKCAEYMQRFHYKVAD